MPSNCRLIMFSCNIHVGQLVESMQKCKLARKVVGVKFNRPFRIFLHNDHSGNILLRTRYVLQVSCTGRPVCGFEVCNKVGINIGAFGYIRRM